MRIVIFALVTVFFVSTAALGQRLRPAIEQVRLPETLDREAREYFDQDESLPIEGLRESAQAIEELERYETLEVLPDGDVVISSD